MIHSTYIYYIIYTSTSFLFMKSQGAAASSATSTSSPRLFEARRRLHGAQRPQLKFWHDAAGWCPHCMVPWRFLWGSASVNQPTWLVESTSMIQNYGKSIGKWWFHGGLVGFYGIYLQVIKRGNWKSTRFMVVL